MTNEIIKKQIAEISKETFTEKFFTTHGRISRMTFLKREVMLILMAFALVFLVEICFIAYTLFGATLPEWTAVITPLIMIVIWISDYCLNVKRLHDFGKDATLAKIFLAFGIMANVYYIAFPLAADLLTPFTIFDSVVNLGFLAYLLYMRGDEGANEYGETK